MKNNLRNFLLKAFSLCLAFILVFPTNLFAMGLDRTQAKKYSAAASLMGLVQSDRTGQGDEEITNQNLLETEISTEETDQYLIEKSARLSKTTGQIQYTIKVLAKDKQTDNKITTSFAISNNTDLKDLKIEKVSQVHSDNTQTDIKYQEQRPSILYANDSLETLGVTTDKADLVYYLSANLTDDALANIEEKSPIMDLDINVAEKGTNVYQDRYTLTINQSETITGDQKTISQNLEEKEEDQSQTKVIYKEANKNLLGENKASITWIDFIHAKDDKEITYDLKVDESQEITESQIKIEYYGASETGYILNEDYSKTIPFAPSLNLQIPQGYIARVEFTTKAKGNPKVFSFNNKKIQNPAYVEESADGKEASQEEDTDPLPENKAPARAKRSASPLKEDAESDDSTLEVSDQDHNPVGEPLDQGQYQSEYPYSVEYTSTSTVRNQDGSTLVTAIPDFSKNPEVWWDIELDTKDMRDTKLKYDRLYYTLFMGAKDGLKQFKYKASTNKQDLETTGGYITAGVNSTYLYQAIGNVPKNKLGEKLFIRVKAPLDKDKVVHDQYSLGIRVNPDDNFIRSLLDEFNRKYDSLPTPFKWKRGTEEAKKFLNAPFDLLDERIVAIPQFRKYDVEDQFYFDTSRSITAERFSDTRIKWSILDLIRTGEKEDSNLDKVVLSPADQNKIEKFYYRPNIGGGYSRINNKEAVTMPDGSLYPGTIVSYNYTNQQGSQNTRYTLTANLQNKEEKFTDIIKNMMAGKTALINPVGGSVEAFTLKRPKSELDDEYFAYYENPFTVMRINKTFEMVECFNDGIKNPSYNGTGDKIGLQRIEDPDPSLLYNIMYGSRVEAARRNLEQGGKFYQDGKSADENLKDALERAYYYTAKAIDAEEARTGKKVARQVEGMIYQKMVHYVTNDKPVLEHYTLPTGWYDPNKNDWSNKDETLVAGDDSLSFTGDKTGTHRQIPENESRVTPNDNNALEIALRLADISTKALEDSYKNGDWTEDKADSVNLVFYKHGYGTDFQNLITAKVNRPLQVQKLTITGENIEGATFKFTNRYTGKSKEWTSQYDNSNNPLYLSPGQYYVEESTPPAGYAPLDTFIIEVKEEEINPDNGKFPLYKIDIHVNDGYKNVVELVSDPAYPIQKDQAGNPLVSVEEGTLNLNIKNEEGNLGSIDFIKTNGKRLLDGAEFKLTMVNSIDDPSPVLKANGDMEYEQTSTGTNGTFLFRSMPEGIYKLEETKAPEGYVKAKTYYLEAKKNAEGKVEVKFLDQQIEDSRQIVNRAESTELTFRKIKQTAEGEEIVPLDSGVFRLYSLSTVDDSSYDRTARPSKSFVEGEDGASPLEVGEFRFADLVEGDYILEEIQAPTGYKKEELPYWRVKVTRDNNTKKLKYEVYKLNSGANPTPIEESQILRGNEKIEGSTFNITNKARTISDTFQKLVKNPNYKEGNGEEEYIPVDKNLRGENGEPVSFRLYAADYYGNKKDPNDRGKKLVADENGLFHLDNLEFSSYYLLEEENPPEGYSKAANTVLYVASEAEVESGAMKIIARDLTANTYTIQGKIFKGIIDYEIGDQFGDLVVKKTGQSLNDDSKEVGLRRAYFRLYYADADFNYADEKFQKVENQADSFYIQRVTAGSALTRDDGTGEQENIPDEDLPNDQGIARFEHLKPGNYILVEHRGPAGYEKDPTPRYVKVTASGRVIKSSSKDDPTFKEEDVPNISDYRANALAEANEDELMISDVSGNRQALKASRAGVGTWEDVVDYRSDDPFHTGNYYNQTRITQIDKTNHKFKQVFLLKNPNNLKLKANLHRQPLANLVKSDVNISLSYVDDDSTVDNLINPVPIKPFNLRSLRANEKDPDTNADRTRTHLRLETTQKLEANKTIAVEVEVSYDPSSYVGMGMDFFYEQSAIYEKTWSKAWAAEKYNSDKEINYKDDTTTEEIVEVETTPYETQRKPSDKLLEGTEVIFQPGQDGKKLVTYKVTYVNGKEASREKVKEEIISEKQDEIIHYGTKKDDTPILPSGQKKIDVNFLYNNMDQLGNVDKALPSEGRAGTMSLQVEKNGEWVDVSDKIQDVPYEGKLEFGELGQGKYRLVYHRDQTNAENWGLPRTTTFAIDLSEEGKDEFKFTISNGNLLRVFDKNETGFRIPLRVTKKDENGSALSGAEFTAKKIIRGSEGIYKEEEFDAVSEATGLAGDNYFRELTPGIYELTETQAPKSKNEAESLYEQPKNKDGELQKWYFEVKRNPEVSDPRAQNYMIINFKFKHTFATSDDFTEAGKDYKENHIGETIYGTAPYEEDGKIANEDFMKLIKLVEDDGRSNPARPDAPYQRIDDLEVTNIKKTTKFSFVKADQYAKSLAGAKFRLTKLATNDKGEIQKELGGAYKFDKNEKDEFVYQKEATSTTDQAELKFDDVLAGKYLLEEIEAPNGYEKLENPILIEFRISPETGKWEQVLIPQDGVKYIDFIDLIKSGENKGKIDIIKNKPLVTELKFKKIDQKGNMVDTSAFSLDKVDQDGDLIDQEGKKLQEGGIQAYHKVIRHWNSNEFVFDNLSEGYYKLEEINPTTYQRPSPTFFEVVKNKEGKLDIVFDDEEENVSKDKDKDGFYSFKNFEKIRFDFTKVGDDGKTPLFGAQFTLKKVLTDKKSRGGKEIYDKEGKVVEGLEPYKYESFDSSGSYGKIRFRDLSQGVYELEETAVPYGYDRLHAKRKWIITVEKNAKGDGLEIKYDKAYEKEYYENDPTYNEKDENVLTIGNDGITVKNTSNTTDLKFNKVDRNGTTIEKDTTFILAKLSDDPDDIKDFDKLTDYKSYFKLREEDGKFEIKGLSRGIYVLRETNAPQGFFLAERDIILKVVEESENSDKLIIKAYEYDKEKKLLIKEEKDFKYYSVKDGILSSTINIANDYKGELPQTGGSGTKIAFALIGTAVMLTALAYFGILNNSKIRRR